jgi:RNA-directed DNA polymerase
MKVSHVEGLANHSGPESCLDLPQGGGEALTGGRAGRPLSRERHLLRGADAVRRCGRPHPVRRYRETPRDPARSETPSMHASNLYGTREIPWPPAEDGAAGRIGKSEDTRR